MIATPAFPVHSVRPQGLFPSEQSDLTVRARQLAATEIAYVDHPEFRKRDADHWAKTLDRLPRSSEPEGVSSSEGLAFLSAMVRSPLLTPDDERSLFLLMNYRKSQADRWRRQIRVTNPNPELIDRIESALQEAETIRNRIAEANLRLVVATARKLSRSLDQLSDLISEGQLPLLRAVELFDVGRGNRFSTYATWAVRNQMLRSLRRRRSRIEFISSHEEFDWTEIADQRQSASQDERQHLQRQFQIERLLGELPEREQQIVAARFGLRGEPAGQSLSQIADRTGLSKERVRQIVLVALEKLRGETTLADLKFDESD